MNRAAGIRFPHEEQFGNAPGLTFFVRWESPYFSTAAPDKQFDLWSSALNNNQDVTYAVWAAAAGEGPASKIEEVTFPDPERTIESYQASLGLPGTFDNFISHAKTQSKFSWDPRFASAAVNRYVREGFGLK